MSETNILLIIIQFIVFPFLCTIHFSSSQSINFTYSGFNYSNLSLQQATVIKPSGALRLTNTTPHAIGHAFYPSPIPMFTSPSNVSSSFTTYFVFQIHPSGRNRGGYGLAFTISPFPRFPNAAGEHYLGVFNPQNNGNPSNHIFMVEFDTVNGYNEETDTDGNHVGININGMDPVVNRPVSYYVNGGPTTEEFDLESGEPIQAWIDYDAVRGQVNVTVAPSSVTSKPTRSLISENINLSTVMEEYMYLGFSAATGRKSSSHYILGWSFSLNGVFDPLDVSRLPYVPKERSSSTRSRVNIALISTFSVLLFILLAALVTLLFYRREMKFEVLEDWERDCPHRFRYRELYLATKGFKASEIIGAGGFGSVYKGVLPATGVEVAVKKIMSNNSLQGYREFAAEVESLGRLRHKHLVNLQGWCKHKTDLLLVYEYVPNGSLDSLLYNSKSGTILTWEQRYNVIKGVASGLLYLHEEWEQVVIHRDVKSSNVLIDGDMNPKLGDFGLARLYDHGKTSHTTNVVGTIGYIAPELTRVGKASTSSDVFAFGILLLEVACGRGPVVYEENVILVDWVVECMQRGNILDVVDAKLDCLYDVEEMELVLGLGLLCSHPKPEARPTMREVIKYLNGDEVFPVFDKLSSAGSRRVDEVTSRLLALGLGDISATSTTLYNSSSVGQMSSTSLDTGR